MINNNYGRSDVYDVLLIITMEFLEVYVKHFRNSMLPYNINTIIIIIITIVKD